MVCTKPGGQSRQKPKENPLSRESSKSAPAILIVPGDRDVFCADVAPPVSELFTRDVERSWRDQMVEDDRMLFAPVEARDVIQIVVVEEMTRDSRTGLTAI